MSKPKEPDITKALREFVAAMDECEDQCARASFAIHEGEDPLWDALWKHEKAFAWLIGGGGAIFSIVSIIALHLSRGGSLF